MSEENNKLVKACESLLNSEDEAEEITPEEQLELDIQAFNANPVSDLSVVRRVRRYQERGAVIAMPHKVYCERVGREVYFMDYTFKGHDKDECIEGNPTVPKCPFAKQGTDGNIPCEHYNRHPFGRETVSVDVSKIKKKKD